LDTGWTDHTKKLGFSLRPMRSPWQTQSHPPAPDASATPCQRISYPVSTAQVAEGRRGAPIDLTPLAAAPIPMSRGRRTHTGPIPIRKARSAESVPKRLLGSLERTERMLCQAEVYLWLISSTTELLTLDHRIYRKRNRDCDRQSRENQSAFYELEALLRLS
jgi:hypothetical protein